MIKPSSNTSLLKSKIVDFARDQIGFDDCRFTTPFLKKEIKLYEEWIHAGNNGDMEYLERHTDIKRDLTKLLPRVQTAIVVTKNYKNTKTRRLKGPLKIARYAIGRDYHLQMKKSLKNVARFIEANNPNAKCYVAVDSSPIPERSLALRAGIGFLGKNTMVIKPGLGSYFFIGIILTTLKLPFDPKMKWDCGTCRLCLDACPTQAFNDDFTMNATKCISYQTIERKEPLTADEIKKTEGWMFGCDICQEVCPYNNDSSPLTDWPVFTEDAGIGFDFLEKLSAGGERVKIPKDSPLYRSRKRVRENIKTAKNISS